MSGMVFYKTDEEIELIRESALTVSKTLAVVAEYIGEGVKEWSYMKFPFIKSVGTQDGWYRVGPLSRLNTCAFIDTPMAEAKRQEFMELGGGKPINVTMAYHWARMIELLFSAEGIRMLLEDPDLLGDDLVARGEMRNKGIGVIEAPRGTLSHWCSPVDSSAALSQLP